MSTTRQEITEHPSAQGVTAPASGKALEADVQRKMKLWGVVEAFRDGRMPDNKQIDDALAYAQANAPVDINKLSPDGKLLVDDARDIIETLRAIIQEKNADEVFQNALWSSYTADPKVKADGVVPVSQQDAKKDADQAAAHLRVLLTLFITNSEVRKLAKDLGFVGRDIFAQGAAKAVDKARPTQEQLDQIDQEAPSKQWIGADGKKLGPNDTPDVQLKAADGSQVRYNPKDAPGNAQVIDADGNARSAGSVYDEAQQKKAEAQKLKEQAKDQAKSTAGSEADKLDQHRDPNASLSQQKDQVLGAAQSDAQSAQRQGEQQANQADSNVDRDEAERKAREGIQGLKNKIPEEHRAALSDGVNASKQIVQDAFPQERREQFIYRLKKVVVELQEHKDYREAMGWLLDTFDQYEGHAEHVAAKGQDAAGGVVNDPAVQSATLKFRRLLERFANGKSLDGIYSALDQLYSDSKNDAELRQWWSSANDYVHRILLEPGYILEDDADREGRALLDNGEKFFTQKYKGHQERFFDEVQLWFTAFAEDPLNQRLGDDVKKLTKDLLFNEEGNLSFKPQLWNDLRTHFLPAIINQIGYVPIPRAEYEDNNIALVVENLILSGPNLFPNVVELQSFNSFKFSPYQNINKTLDNHHHKLRLGMSQIQADIRDVAFSFKRKSGWPKLSDHGLADVIISGKGISIDAEIETVEGKRDTVFKVNSVHVDIDHMTWKIRDSKHDLLYKFLKGTATGVIKKAIQTAVSSAIRNALEEADSQITQIRNTADEAKKSDETTRKQAIKDLYDRKKRDAEKNKQAAQDKTGTFRIVTNRESQLNPDMTHDKRKSIAERVFKTEDLAHSGKDWHSPAFSLVGDDKHPAITGQNHPEAKAGAGAGKSLTDAIPSAGASGNQAPAGK